MKFISKKIKNETQAIQSQIVSFKLKDGQSTEIKKNTTQRIVVSYSQARALRDAHNRNKGLERLKKQIITGKLSKANINNKGYNKYLKLEGEIKVVIDYDKFKDDDK